MVVSMQTVKLLIFVSAADRSSSPRGRKEMETADRCSQFKRMGGDELSMFVCSHRKNSRL